MGNGAGNAPGAVPGDRAATPSGVFRRIFSLAGLAVVLWIGVFGPLGLIGREATVDYESVPLTRLFELHAIFALFVVGWYVVGFVPRRDFIGGAREVGRWGFAAQLGFAPSSAPRMSGASVSGAPVSGAPVSGAPVSGTAAARTAAGRWRDVGREIGVGALFGVAGWLVVLTILLLIGSLIWVLGGEDALPSEPPSMVLWVAGLPWLVRLGISISAGVVEETFFRGLLQPRCGIALSTVLFVLAHAGYEQPLMLVGVTLLSLFFSALVVWRQSILAAITAHTVFDAVQLLVVIPSITRLMGDAAGVATLGGVPGGVLGGGIAPGLTSEVARVALAWAGGHW